MTTYRLVTPNTEPEGFTETYESLRDSRLVERRNELLSNGHKYVRAIIWPPEEVGKWFIVSGRVMDIEALFGEWSWNAYSDGIIQGHAYEAYRKTGFSYEWLKLADKYHR